jgi:hypothetical protein
MNHFMDSLGFLVIFDRILHLSLKEELGNGIKQKMHLTFLGIFSYLSRPCCIDKQQKKVQIQITIHHHCRYTIAIGTLY